MKIDNILADDAVLAELGQRMAAARLGRRMTQAELAAAAGVSKRTVERLEDGAPAQLDNFIRCLRALERLDALDALLPAPSANPIDLLQRRLPRSRARRPAAAPSSAPWAWGDGK